MSNQTDRLAAIVDSLGIQPTNYESAFHQYWDDAGIPSGEFNQRFVVWARDATGLDSYSLPSLQAEVANQVGAGSWNEVGAAFADILSRWRYVFDGTDYASLNTGWQNGGFPSGYSAKIKITGGSGGGNRGILTGILNTGLYLNNGNPATIIIGYRNESGTITTNFPAVSPELVEGVDYLLEVDLTAGQVPTLKVDGVAIPLFTAAVAAGYQPALTAIGSGPNGTGSFFTGAIWNVASSAASVLQGGTLVDMDGSSITGVLNNTIECDANGDFTIEFDWERTEVTGTSSQFLMGNTSDTGQYIRMYDTNTNDVRLNVAASRVWSGGLASIAVGQKSHYKFTRVSSVYALEIDGVVISSPPGPSAQPVAFNWLGRGANGTRGRGLFGNADFTVDLPQQTRGFLPFGSVHTDIQEQFSATSLSDAGSLSNTANCDFDGSGMLIPIAEAPLWNSYAGLAATGFTIQFEVESGMFAALIDQGINGWSMLRFQSGEVIQRRNAAQNIIWAHSGGYSASRSKTISDGLGSHVTVTVDFDPSAGTGNGKIVAYLDALPYIEFDLVAAMDTSNIFVATIGTFVANESAPPFRFRNFMVMEGPMNQSIPTAKNIAVVGASFVRQGQYQSGYANTTNTPVAPTPDPQNVPMRAGFYYPANAEYAAISHFKNSTLFAGLHRAFADKAIPIAGDYLWNFGRGGCTVHDWSGSSTNILNHRMDAAYGLAPNLPTPAVGTNVVNYWISIAGGNDMTYINSNFTQAEWDAKLDLFIASYKGVIDSRMLAYGATEKVVITSIQYNAYPDALADACNAKLYAAFDGYMSVVSVADISALDSYGYWDGSHPGAEGQQYIARQVGAKLPNLALTGQQSFTYPLDEGSGDLITNTDLATGEAFNGKWDATNWVYEPTNNRKYRMSEGAPETDLIDSLHDPLNPSDTDATLSSASGWVEE